MDAEWMRLALELAALGEGAVHPNPLVGAVVVCEGRVVGRGYHRRFGGPHAEVFALDEAGDAARGAILYVTLEPCCHHGKTPPCTDRIIAAGVRRVVIGARDPNPEIDGEGIACLRAAGIEVDEGVLVDEATKQNEIFFTFIRRRQPFVQLKLATSLDGRIATKTGDSQWISSEASRTEVHRLRRRFMSVLVGVRTVLSDDPLLTVRHIVGPNPVPVILDRRGRFPPDARLLDAHSAPIVATATMPTGLEQQLCARGTRVWRLRDAAGGVDLPRLLALLAEDGIDSVLIEGGGETAATFLDAGLVDKVSLFIAPILIGGRGAVPAVGGAGAERVADALRLQRVTTEWTGPDLLYEGYPVQRKR
jgi:diaminohydroxyphosphoribosylaminopyrimidine deaminase/5-amino-6-(5-phosphoribosylamino)uracil reductase